MSERIGVLEKLLFRELIKKRTMLQNLLQKLDS